MTVRAIDVPDIRLKFIDYWGPRGGFHTGTIERLMKEGMSYYTGSANARLMEESIKVAEMFWVSPTFLPLLINAADSLPLDAKFSEIPPLPSDGLLVFDAPDGWSFDEDGDPDPEVAAISWLSAEIESAKDGTTETGVYADSYACFGGTWVDLRSFSWRSGDTVSLSKSYADRFDSSSVNRLQRDRRILGAFAHLITQEFITDAKAESMPRPVERRSARQRVPSTVRVVRLRQLAESERKGSLTGSEVEYSHQWLVSGHWRNQPCGTGRHERKLIWVNPYVKGPSDKPLVLKDTVKALVR